MNEPKVCKPYTDGNPMGVEAHRHINPDGSEGGWVAERATVDPAVYVDPRATIEGGTIWGGTIYGGTIRGGTIRGGTIRGGTIRGGTIEGGTIWGGTIWGGTIRGGTIRGGDIWGGTIEGGTIEGGTIWGGTIWGGTIRGGDIWGGTIEGGDIWGGTIRAAPSGRHHPGGTIRGGTIWSDRDVLTIGPIGSENQHATLVRDPGSDAGHILTIGCWRQGTVDGLAAEVQERCPDRAAEYAEIEAVLRRRLAEWAAADEPKTTEGKNR